MHREHASTANRVNLFSFAPLNFVEIGVCLLQIVPLHFRPSFTRDRVAEWSTRRTRVRVQRSDD